ncbi:uncharacterized protein B0H64DRAFT_479370 [Chaetomium fimeti]|uniref:Uncharacterized protein n=1 Tax=Chaetomium fimeti TaxID=1854472 RepID=A0AAE0H523_9PEZI|nr:hypothetical protein B0H64DRAFT_479370 [Chaetomium fimeti]
MGCCGLFNKNKKSKTGANGFAPRPVQQVVQGGKVGYQPTAAALQAQQQHTQQYGGGGNIQDAEYLKSLATNKAIAGSAADFAVRGMGPRGQKFEPYAQKGANLAAQQFTKQQYKGRQQDAAGY